MRPDEVCAPSAEEGPHERLEVSDRARELTRSMCRPLSVDDPASQVSVVSFNMLLKGFESKPYYPEVDPGLRAWRWRKPRLEELLKGLDADLYCMQEVEVDSFADEFSFLEELGYEAVAPQDGGKPKKLPAGAPPRDLAKCAFFYRASRLELVWSERRSRAVLAAFRHAGSGRLLYAASCHLEGAPGEAAARVSQTRSALERLALDQRRRGLAPEECCVVFAGDFNSSGDSAVCQLLREGRLEQSFRDPWAPDVELVKQAVSHEFVLSDVYGLTPSRPPTFCCPCAGRRPKFVAIDFVFFSPRTLSCVAIREPYTPEQFRAASSAGTPSEWHFSDHVPVGGVFEFAGADTQGSPPAHGRPPRRHRLSSRRAPARTLC